MREVAKLRACAAGEADKAYAGIIFEVLSRKRSSSFQRVTSSVKERLTP